MRLWGRCMKYWIEGLQKKWMYTEKLLLHILKRKGHAHALDSDSIIIASLCDVTDIPKLAKLRARYPDNKILAGGHFAKIGVVAMSLFADAVCVGHAYDMFNCTSWGELCELPCVFTGDRGKQIDVSYNIDWRLAPVVQTDSKRFYVWGGIGCKNKCSFCLTSWTEPHIDRPGVKTVAARAKKQIGHKGSVKIISNAYSPSLGDDLVQDMLLKDLLRVRSNTKRKMIRCGLEFATTASRKRNAKPITDEQLRRAIAHAGDLNLDLHLFCIGGYDRIEDWDCVLDAIPESDAMSPRVFFKWTNLEYQQKTPLWRHVKEIDFDRYLDASFTARFFRKAAHKNKRVRVMPVKYPAHAIWRICMSNVQDMEQYKIVEKAKNVKDMEEIKRLFATIKPWENDLGFVRTRFRLD